jgi:ABC-type transport system involved in cytochrome c biogenesis permease component
MTTFGLSAAFLSPKIIKAITPTIIWVLIFGTSAILGERSFEPDLRNRAYEAIILSKVNLRLVFVSKVLFQAQAIALNTLVILCVLEGTLRIHLFNVLVNCWPVFLISIVSFSCLNILVGSMTSISQLKGALFPILILPNIFPLFLACIELTFPVIVEGQTINYLSNWSYVLVLCFTCHISLGILLYPILIRS